MSDAGLREGDLLTIAQARKLVPLARSTFYHLIESGALPCYRFGVGHGRVLVARADLEALVARARHVALKAPTAPDVGELLRRVRARRRGIGAPNGESG